MFHSWTTTAAPEIRIHGMNKEKLACLITFFVSACAFHQLDADYDQPGQQILQIKRDRFGPPPWRHCIFHQHAICRQKDGENDLGTDIFTEGPIMKARIQQPRSCLTASIQFKFSRHPFRIWIVYLWWKDGMLNNSRMTVTLKACRYYSGAHHAFSRTWRSYPWKSTIQHCTWVYCCPTKTILNPYKKRRDWIIYFRFTGLCTSQLFSHH
jgi:hypothetical protein